MEKRLSAILAVFLLCICSASSIFQVTLSGENELELTHDDYFLSDFSNQNFSSEIDMIENYSSEWGSTYYDIVIDSDSLNNVHILYKSNYDNLTHAVKTSEGWVTQHILVDTNVLEFDMAIDSNDSIHISWEDYDNRDLMYTTNSSGEWTTVSVDTSGRRGDANSIAIDSNNKPHITYTYGSYRSWYEDYSYYLQYATLADNGNWEKETIQFSYVSDSSYSGGVYQTDVSVDHEDTVHVAYVIYDASSNNGLWYASGNYTDWDKKRLQNNAHFYYPSISFDSQNKAHIAFEGVDGEIIYTKQNSTGAWNQTIVDNSSSFSDPSIVVDAYGNPHITYIDIPTKVQKYATGFSENWQAYNLSNETDFSTTTAIELSKTGDLHTALLNSSGVPYHSLIQYPDSDLDGISELRDLCPSEGNPNYDIDRDGCLDDFDNDGVYDYQDLCPDTNATGYDTDNDGCIDDSDGDGVGDHLDLFPEDSTETNDTDGDGVGDNSDRCEGYDDSIDIDSDDVVDGCDDLLDNDRDGVSNDDDVFPEDGTESIDTDLDGIGDNSDPDIDGDGYANDIDDFPTDKLRNKDSDGDGISDFTEGIIEGQFIDFESGNMQDVNIRCADDLIGLCDKNNYAPWVITNESISGDYSIEQELWSSDTGYFSIEFNSAKDDVVTFQIYITTVIIEQQCIPIFLNDEPIDYGCTTEGFGYYDNITINVTEGQHVLKFFGTILGSGNKVDNIRLPDYLVSFNEDEDDDNDGWNDDVESSFKDTSPCYGDPLDPNINPRASIDKHLEEEPHAALSGFTGDPDFNAPGYCMITYNQDGDEVADYYTEEKGFVQVDMCPEEYGYNNGEWVVNDTTGESEFNGERIGCPLESEEDVKSSSDENSALTYGIGIGVIVAIIVAIFFVRKGGGSILDESVENASDSQEVEQHTEQEPSEPIFSDMPPENAVGMLNDDGYYWIEWPIASGKWCYRAPNETNWTLFEN